MDYKKSFFNRSPERNPLFLTDMYWSVLVIRVPWIIFSPIAMLLGCREQILSVKNKGFLAGDRLKKRIFYSPSRKFRREVCFGTYCKFLNYPLPAISFESNFYSIIKFLLVLLMKYRFMIKKSVPRSKYFSTKIIRNGEEIPSVMW